MSLAVFINLFKAEKRLFRNNKWKINFKKIYQEAAFHADFKTAKI